MQSSSYRHYKQIINPCLEDVSPEMYVHDEPSTQVAYSTKQTKAMLGYLNKANEEEAVNGRTDRGNERGMSKKEACMNTATTNRGCYSRLSSTPPQVVSEVRGVLRETTKASHFNFSLAAYVQCCYLDVAAINWIRSTFYCCVSGLWRCPKCGKELGKGRKSKRCRSGWWKKRQWSSVSVKTETSSQLRANILGCTNR